MPNKQRCQPSWKSKIWRLFLLHYPPEYPRPTHLPRPRDKHNLIQSLVGLEHYMKSYLRYRPTQLAFTMVIANLSLSVMKYVRKYPRNRTLNQIKFEFWGKMLGENKINSKLKCRKAHNSILSGRLGDQYGIRESWHVWISPNQQWSGSVVSILVYAMMWMLCICMLWLVIAHDLLECRYMDDVTTWGSCLNCYNLIVY